METSTIQFARLVGPANSGNRMGDFSNASITELEFEIPEDMPFAFLEIEDSNGKRAWTNNLFRSSQD